MITSKYRVQIKTFSLDKGDTTKQVSLLKFLALVRGNRPTRTKFPRPEGGNGFNFSIMRIDFLICRKIAKTLFFLHSGYNIF